MVFRMRYKQAGGHTHIRFFAGSHEGALGKCGDITMRNDEFKVFREAATFIQFVPEMIEPSFELQMAIMQESK